MEPTWPQLRTLADKLTADPLAGMDVLADLCSHLTALTHQGLSENKLAITALKNQLADLAATHPTSRITELEKAINELATLTRAGLAENRNSIDLQQAMIDNIRQKLSEHQTQLSELFGGPPGKLSQRIDSLGGDLATYAQAIKALEIRVQNIDDRLKTLAAVLDHHTTPKLAHLADRVRNLESEPKNPSHQIPSVLEQRLDSLIKANNETVLSLAAHKADPTLHPRT